MYARYVWILIPLNLDTHAFIAIGLPGISLEFISWIPHLSKFYQCLACCFHIGVNILAWKVSTDLSYHWFENYNQLSHLTSFDEEFNSTSCFLKKWQKLKWIVCSVVILLVWNFSNLYCELNPFSFSGNLCMSKNQFREAVECYAKAIELNSLNAVYYCNRWVFSIGSSLPCFHISMFHRLRCAVKIYWVLLKVLDFVRLILLRLSQSIKSSPSGAALHVKWRWPIARLDIADGFGNLPFPKPALDTQFCSGLSLRLVVHKARGRAPVVSEKRQMNATRLPSRGQRVFYPSENGIPVAIKNRLTFSPSSLLAYYHHTTDFSSGVRKPTWSLTPPFPLSVLIHGSAWLVLQVLSFNSACQGFLWRSISSLLGSLG